jgi:uncharacterized membrane-anchored protein
MTIGRRTILALSVITALAACRPDDQRTDSVDPADALQERATWAPEMVEHLDAGNAAIRADSFDVAREHFMVVTEMAPDVAAGWFGLYLAEKGRGDDEAASAALERAQSIASGASLIHPEGEGGGP